MSDITLKKRTITALFWSFLDKFGQKVIFLVSSVFLMRLLDTSDYGIMGSLLIFIAFSSLLFVFLDEINCLISTVISKLNILQNPK